MIIAVSVAGPSHIVRGIPCQDFCAYKSQSSGLRLIAVADGLGSAIKADSGARIAVRVALRAGVRVAARCEFCSGGLSDIPKVMFASAREALLKNALTEGREIRDFACTLIAVALFHDRMAVVHIGDGAVVARVDGNLKLVSGPSNPEYANEVVPLTSEDWMVDMRVSEAISGVECVAVFTDGCQHAGLKILPDGLAPFHGFFDPVFSYGEGLADLGEGRQEVKNLLSSAKICEHSQDDKTLVLAVLKGRSFSQ